MCLSCATYEQAQAYCPTCAPEAVLPNADLGVRFVGNFIDMLAFWGVFAAGALMHEGMGPWVPLLGACLLLGTNLTLLLRRGQTLGKMVVSTRMVTIGDQPVSWWRVVLRSVVEVVATATGTGFIDAAFILGSSRRTLHDRVAGTRVVKAAASERVYKARAA